jgi:hypothetical protein
MITPLLGILMILATLGLAVLATVALVQARLTQRPAPWRTVILGGAAWATLYVAMLLSASLTSREGLLGLNEDKKFCGFYIDCHMQVAVTRVDTARQAGSFQANGLLYIVTVRVSSDAVAARLRLLDPRFVLRDARGREYAPATVADRDSLSRLVGPQQSFNTTVVFAVPEDASALRLDVTMGIWADRLIEFFLIGDEDSFLHKRTGVRIAA